MSRFDVTITKGRKGTPTRTNTSPTSSPNVGPALKPSQIAELLAERRAASRSYQSSQVAAREQEQMLAADAVANARDRRRQYDRFTGQAMDVLGDRGMAFQPIGAGQQLRQIRDAEAFDAAGSEADLALDLAAVAEAVAAARRARDRRLAELTGIEQGWRSDLIRNTLSEFQY